MFYDVCSMTCMTRLSKKPIIIPEGVNVRVENGILAVKGKKGELAHKVPHEISLDIAGDGRSLTASPAARSKNAAELLGTTYVHARNMITDVSEGFMKTLEIEGVGYRAALDGKNLVLSLGYSHPVRYVVPEGIEVVVEKSEIRISGVDRELVGHVAAAIRHFRKPEPYKGKGIRYKNEKIARKAGKKAGVGA